MSESQMMWKVSKALREAMERIETLEAKVQPLLELEARIAMLESN